MPPKLTPEARKNKAQTALVAAFNRHTDAMSKADQAITAAYATAYEAGLTLDELSEVTGWSVDRIRKRLVDLGVQMRPRGYRSSNGN